MYHQILVWMYTYHQNWHYVNPTTTKQTLLPVVCYWHRLLLHYLTRVWGAWVAVTSRLDHVALEVVFAAELFLAARAWIWLQSCNNNWFKWCVMTYSNRGDETTGTYAHPCVCTCGEPGCPCQDNGPHILGMSMCHLPSGWHDGVAPDLTSVWSSLHNPHIQSRLPRNETHSEQVSTTVPQLHTVKKWTWMRSGSNFTEHQNNV